MKWLQVLQFNSDYCIEHYSFICTQSNGSKYGYVIPIIKYRRTVKSFKYRYLTQINLFKNTHWFCTQFIGLYTPINYFGRYATCSHNKDGGRPHIQSRETIGQENHVTCLKLRVHFRPAFGASYKTRIFYKYVVFKHFFSLLPNFFAAATHSLQWELTGVKSNNMDGPRRHSKYTLTMRRFPVSEKLPVSNHKKKDILNMQYFCSLVVLDTHTYTLAHIHTLLFC